MPPQQDKWRILRIVLTVLVAAGAGAKVFDVVTHSDQPAVQTQPIPSTSPPAQPPQQTAPAQTAEGVSVVKTQEPLPHLRAGRVNNDPNSLMIYFGVPVGNSALSYQVNFIFTKNQQRGVGFAAAFSGNQTATTGTIAADHFWKADTKEMSLILSGPMTANPFNAPSICLLAHIGPRLDRIDIDSTSFAASSVSTDRPLAQNPVTPTKSLDSVICNEPMRKCHKFVGKSARPPRGGRGRGKLGYYIRVPPASASTDP